MNYEYLPTRLMIFWNLGRNLVLQKKAGGEFSKGQLRGNEPKKGEGNSRKLFVQKSINTAESVFRWQTEKQFLYKEANI